MASEPAETKNMAARSDAISSFTTRQSRVRKREGAIVSSARQIFITHGYAKATMAMIARDAGVADGTLYTYFENKDALARAVIADYYARLTGTARDGVESRRTTRKRLEFLARHHITSILEERGIIEMLPVLMASLKDYSQSELYGLNKTYVAVFDGVIREGRAQGDIPGDADVAVLRDIFFGALDYGAKSSLIRSSQMAARKADITRLVDQLVTMIVGSNVSTPSLADRLEAVATRVETALSQMEKR